MPSEGLDTCRYCGEIIWVYGAPVDICDKCAEPCATCGKKKGQTCECNVVEESDRWLF